MGDELRGENLVHLNVRFSTETELKKIQDFLYEKSGQGVSFTGLVEAMANEVTIVTAVHNIKSNKGSRTAGVDKIKMDKYLQMPKAWVLTVIFVIHNSTGSPVNNISQLLLCHAAGFTGSLDGKPYIVKIKSSFL